MNDEGSQPRYSYPGALIEWDAPEPEGEVIERSAADARERQGDCQEVPGLEQPREP